MSEYKLATLPEVDEVVVIHAKNHWIQDILKNMESFNKFPTSGYTAEQISDLWRSLRPAETMRCHTPPYALQFKKHGKIILSVTLCWHCNNMFIDIDGEESSASFDGRAPEATELLMILGTIG